MKYDDSWLGVLSKSALNGLAEYYKQSETLIKSAKKADLSGIERKVIERGMKFKLTPDEKYSERNLLINVHEVTYDMFFTNYFRYSCIVLITLILEDHLGKLSRALYKTKGGKRAPPRPEDATIDTCRNYIASLRLTYDNSLWDFMDDLKCIRNCIVHSSGDVSRRNSTQQAKLESITKKNIGVHIGRTSTQYQMTPLYLDDDMIIIESRYCETTIHNVTNLFKAICKSAGLPLKIKFNIKK